MINEKVAEVIEELFFQISLLSRYQIGLDTARFLDTVISDFFFDCAHL